MPNLNKLFRLGDWTIEPGRSVIECGGEERHLEPKAMEMLVYLAAHAGVPVPRETLGKEIWAGNDPSDEAISRVISQLRSQLGDSSRKPRYIETLPKIGYRLLIHPQEADTLTTHRRLLARYSPRAVGLAVMVCLVGVLLTAFLLVRESPLVSPGDAIHTVAVLPFRDFIAAEEGGFLAASLTDEIISILNRSPQLRIVARSSLRELQDMAGSRGIDYYLEGDLGLQDGRVRVHVEIVDGAEGVILWSDTYETSQTDYLAMQKELSERVFRAFNRELGIAAEIPRGDEVNLAAYTEYLNGIFLAKLRGEDPLRAAVEAFSAALAIEPDFDSARVALANVQVLLPFYSEQSEGQAFAEALRQLDALRDPTIAEAEAIRGFMAFREWRWLDAERHFLESLALDPNVANTHLWYSQFLSTVGRLEESLQHAMMAYELDSVSPVVNDRLATAHLWNNQDATAERLFAAGANLGFNSFQNPGYLLLLLRNSNFDAIRVGLRGLSPVPELEPLLARLDSLREPVASQELVAAVDSLIAAGHLMPRLEFGLWIMLGQWSRVLETVEKYRQQKKYLDLEFLFARESELLRSDPLFARIVLALGLDGYWQLGTGPDYR